MSRLTHLTVGLLVVLGMAAPAAADWCHDPSQLEGQILCEDFDRYCQNPPPPYQSCPTGASPDNGALHQVWHPHSWNYNTNKACGYSIFIDGDQRILGTPPFGGRHVNGGDEGGHLGQNVVDLTPYVESALPGYYAANGSDGQPLVLTFTMSGGIQIASKLPWSNGYMELALGDGDPYTPSFRQGGDSPETHAPTDYVVVGAPEPGNPDCFSCYGWCRSLGIDNSGVHVPWPTICQQEFPNPACPARSTHVRPVIAVGALAALDNDPCHCDTPDSQKPNNMHLSFFDGLRWRVLRSGMFPGSGGFVFGDKVDTVTLTIRTSTIEVYHRARVGGIWVDSTATDIPREYLGGFNRLRAGTGVSCELEGAGSEYRCKQAFIWGGGKCLRMGDSRCDGGGWQENGAGYVTFDTVRLSGGVGGTFSPNGACCLPDASCVDDTTAEDCAAMGGQWTSPNHPCSQTDCCPTPYADADHDGDVDSTDFAFLQRCLTIGGGTIQPGCTCLDRDADSDIDATDVEQFISCATGPQIEQTLEGCAGGPR